MAREEIHCRALTGGKSKLVSSGSPSEKSQSPIGWRDWVRIEWLHNLASCQSRFCLWSPLESLFAMLLAIDTLAPRSTQRDPGRGYR